MSMRLLRGIERDLWAFFSFIRKDAHKSYGEGNERDDYPPGFRSVFSQALSLFF